MRFLDIAWAAGTATTRRGAVQRIAHALEPLLPLLALELVFRDADGRLGGVSFHPASGRVEEFPRDARIVAGLEHAAYRRLGVEALPRTREAAAAQACGARELVLLRLEGPHATSYAVLYLGEPSAWLDDDAQRAALIRALSLAAFTVPLIERVAALSRRAHSETRALRQRLRDLGDDAEIVAVSAGMREALHRAAAVARHDVPVLLRGATGTGKELLAKYIHRHSPRADRAFVAVNCGALPESLLESELFGHERGAFTGADRRRIGRFERAHEGTLFLDEVAELSPAAQVKLLRVLQEGELERVGGSEKVRVDVRVIAATHQPLERMLATGRFRADLFYRLETFPILIPSLAERPEDIPELARSLLAHSARRLGRNPPRVRRSDVRRLCAGAWPGNVRELSNVLERALLFSSGDVLELPARVGEVTAETAAAPERLDEAIRRCIAQALTESHGRIHGPCGAAARLGVKPTTLQAKMRKLGLVRAAFVRRPM
jgi:transcriptional regulator with GAF, ATPase, and Fis domain